MPRELSRSSKDENAVNGHDLDERRLSYELETWLEPEELAQVPTFDYWNDPEPDIEKGWDTLTDLDARITPCAAARSSVETM